MDEYGTVSEDVKVALSKPCVKHCDITVILSIRNRGEQFRATLVALAAVVVPEARSVECFLVDNGSIDETAEICREFVWHGVEVHVLSVAQPGLARAQNAALRLCHGSAILFLDDDVRPPRDWLSEMSAPILSGEADAVGGGVRIPRSIQAPWTIPDHEEWLASTEHWESRREPMLVGASMAIARRVFAALGGFDETLVFAIDSMYSQLLVHEGFRLVLRHDVVSEHHVELHRFTRRGLAKQALLRAEWQAFELHHWLGRRPSYPHLRWLLAQWRLVRHRAGLAWRLNDYNLSQGEMHLMQEVALWRVYIRTRKQPRRYRR